MLELDEHYATTNTWLAQENPAIFAQERGCRTESSLCSGCALHHLCIPAGIDRADFDKLGPAIRGVPVRQTRPAFVSYG
jgi:hypothetical protein